MTNSSLFRTFAIGSFVIWFFDAYSTNKLGFYLVSITAIHVPIVKK